MEQNDCGLQFWSTSAFMEQTYRAIEVNYKSNTGNLAPAWHFQYLIYNSLLWIINWMNQNRHHL